MPTDFSRGDAASLGKPLRLHYLDWLRTLMVWCVVYAHTDRTVGSLSVVEDWIADDHARGQADSHALTVRWVSLIRQWCLPLLFWVSGGAAMLGWKGSPKGFSKVLSMTLVGCGANALLWFLSPRDPACSPQDPCPGRGIVFSFNIVYNSGIVFPIVFQMWYTIVLMFYMLLNWPLCLAVSLEGENVGQVKRLAPQWAATVLWSSALIWLSGEACDYPVASVVWIAVTEASFLGIASLAAPAATLPSAQKRLIHYVLAVLTVLQFAVTPFSSQPATLGPSFAAYVLVGFNKFFGLGVVMTQGRSHGVEVEPLMSRYWPVTLIILAFSGPSSNWLLAGNLTFPFYTQAVDRVLYVTGAAVVVYAIDRCSRWSGTECEACPAFLSLGSIILYLFHPLSITALICAGFMDSAAIWLLSSAFFFLLAFVLDRISSGGKRAASAKGYKELPAP